MTADKLDQVVDLCREAAAKIEEHDSYRLRVLMQMLLTELEKERKAGSRQTQA